MVLSISHINLPSKRELGASRRVHRSYATFRTISALMLREMSTTYGRKPGGYVWAVLQPLGIILMLAFAFSLIARSASLGTSFVLFKATGLLVFQLYNIPSTRVGSSLAYSRALLKYPGVTWADAVLARFGLNSLVSIIVMIVILTGDIWVEGLTVILDWSMILQCVVLTLLLAFGVGVLNCYLTERIHIWSTIWGIATAPLMVMSGVLILYDDLPTQAQAVLWYNPLVHLMGMMRAGFYSTYHPQYLSYTVIVLWALVPMFFGVLLLRRYSRDLLAQ